MAASMDGMRVKLVFDDFDVEPSWFYVRLHKNKKVSDIENRIIGKFGLSCESIQLKVSECRLPSWECSGIVRENDCVHVLVSTSNNALVGETKDSTEPNKKKKKKEKRKRESLSESEEEVPLKTKKSDSISDKKKSKSESKINGDNYSNVSIVNHQDKSDSESMNQDSAQNDDDKRIELMKQNAVAEAEKLIALHEANGSNASLEGGQKKKRKRKRKNKKREDTSTQEVKQVSSHNTASFREPVQTSNSSFRQSWTRNPSNKHFTFGDEDSDSKHDESIEQAVDKVNGTREPQEEITKDNSFQTDTQTNATKKTSSNGYDSFQNEHENDNNSFHSQSGSPVIKESVLPSGVSVFTRQRRKPGGYFPPLSKKQQLDTVATNRSFIMVNQNESVEENGQKKETAKASCPKSDYSKASCPKSDYSKASCPKSDYSKYPDLDAFPQTDDKIAYKIIELSSSYTPEVSEYKEAIVLSYNPISTVLKLEITKQCQNLNAGQGDGANENDNIVEVEWSSLISPKLLS